MSDNRGYPARIQLSGVLGWALLTSMLNACGGTIAFSDTSSLVIEGQPPAPPPPKPKRVEVTEDAIVIHEKIQFDFDKATIKPESHELLNEIVEVVKGNPHIRNISIEGHTDSDGSDSYNASLSQGRADAVMAYLVEHGIENQRLAAKGHGESKPIAGNEDDVGKEKNRRVEFIITQQDEIKKTYEVDAKTGERKELSADEKEKGK